MSEGSDVRSAVSLWVVFFVNGAILASWAPRIPEVKSDLGLSDASLGLALFGVAGGSLPALLITGRILRRVPAHVVCTLSSLVFSATLPLIATVSGLWQLAIVLAILGAGSGCLDVAMNTAAMQFDRQRRRRTLSRLHGGYSLGVLAGSSFGALAVHLGLPISRHFTMVAITLCVASAISSRGLPHTPLDAYPTGGSRVARRFAVPVSIAALAVAGLLVEGVLTDWSALLVARDFSGGTSIGAVTVAAFGAAMFVSRSAGDALVTRVGPAIVCRLSAATMVAALAIGLLQPTPTGMACACTVVGLALGPIFPLAIGAAGRRSPRGVAAAAAQISAIGYIAFLAGPPVVGALAEQISLPVTIAVIGIGSGAVIASASSGTADKTDTGRAG